MEREIIRIESGKVAYAAAKAAAEEMGAKPVSVLDFPRATFKGENGSVSVLRDGTNYAVLIRRK